MGLRHTDAFLLHVGYSVLNILKFGLKSDLFIPVALFRLFESCQGSLILPIGPDGAQT